MAKKSDKVYPDKYLDALNKCIQSCHKTAGDLELLRDCGADCVKEIRDNAEQLATAERLKAKMFPDRP